ncbi:hypothetical protein [Neosynechococcus sphagnicola]|uniref:hypothetical protein n=1 Tax=Neosynechococcus sphagnicola TaxID=1501145 RepID=UPI0012E0C3A8|nr:hypothetical protein [Neosynechococcus sphagnicola]
MTSAAVAGAVGKVNALAGAANDGVASSAFAVGGSGTFGVTLTNGQISALTLGSDGSLGTAQTNTLGSAININAISGTLSVT